ncbi:MAG TPA: TIGR02266 family protein [Nitrospiria bacterium]|nr:TIGR02266 family protein [Nitrospiria bacterium]
MTKRKEQRVPVSLSITYTEPGRQAQESFTAVLGGGGCFILSTAPPSEGTRLFLEFTLPDQPRPLRLEGKVAWSRDEFKGSRPAGVGIAFKNISQKDKETLLHFIEDVLTRKI